MVSSPDIQPLLAGNGIVVDREGNKIGSAEQLYVDDQTGAPEWVTVKTGLFGTSESFVPLANSEVRGEELWVAYDKDFVKDAPHGGDTDGRLSQDQEDELYRYYGLVNDSGYPATADVSGDDDTVSRDVSGTTTEGAMTRSEERLNVGTERRESGKVRLRKYVVTENVTQTVPVSHEEVRLEREPITDANRSDAISGPDISEDEHEVTLHDERATIEKETVPVERVKLNTETVTDQEEVSGEVRKERIETEGIDTDDVVDTDARSRR
jgi:uncharacterized protein (TIGR02271 family)